MASGPSRFATVDEADSYARTIPDRFNYGDLSNLQRCLVAYRDADIRVVCHVQYIPNDTPSVRAIGFRAAEQGFFAEQRPDADVVDFYTVSPYDLGAAISDAVRLGEPGRHERVVGPEYLRPRSAQFDAGSVHVADQRRSTYDTIIGEDQVTAYGRVQSDWRTAWKWSYAYDKPIGQFIRVVDDGEYLYDLEGCGAKPLTKPLLSKRIDELIAEDVAVLREMRAASGL
ncbi:hypothetical protein [Mycobacterium sp. 3519A]|uniref:hypothetical protein n=1 Tax=Mycobacterium sp. 3519A TaxID=2057184 RepID=UPI001158FD15|nr:hypothetical protein [Mycobacterium sp. 3519A]